MKSTIVSAASLALLGTASAGVITARQGSFDFSCNGKQNPDTDDCQAVYDIFADPTQTFTVPALPNNIISFDAGDNLNCQVEITWFDRGYVITGQQIYNAINGVSTTCFVQGTGGTAQDLGDRYTIAVRNNPNFVTPGTTKRDNRKVIAQGNMIERERSSAVKAPTSMTKRAEGDNGFTYGVHTTYAKQLEFRTDIDVGLQGTSMWEWNESKSVENSASLSIEVTAGIEGILSSTLGTTISTSETTTSGSSQTLNVVCENNQVGTVFFQAYTQIWKGALQPSGEALTVIAPMRTPDGKTDGFYGWYCSNV